MRKVILMMSVSVDGFIEGPGHELDWHRVDDGLHRHPNDQLRGMGAFLNGRVTDELMARFWPTADTNPSSTGPMVEFARIWREMPKIVFSRTLDPRPRPMSRSLPAGLQRETSERWPGRRTLPGGIFPNGSGGSLGGGVD